MPLQDVLTDLSISLKEYEMEERPFNILKTQVHLGMHQTAMNIAEELLQLKILSKSFEEFPVGSYQRQILYMQFCCT